MKISMWMITEKLETYHPISNIPDGAARITGVRFLSDPKDIPPELHFVYLYQNDPSVTLINGTDTITVHTQNINAVLNDLLDMFDYYNHWEKALWDAAASKSFQQIIDLGHEVLGNPMMVSDMDGNVIAASSAFAGNDLNSYWAEAQVSRRVPTAVLRMPLYSPDGKPASWTDTPEVYILPDGTKIIGTYIKLDGKLIAGFALWQANRQILPSDTWLMQILYEVMISTLEAQHRRIPVHFCASILKDLLAEKTVDDELIRHLEEQIPRPRRLLLIRNPIRNNKIYENLLGQHLIEQEPTCVPLPYEDGVVVLTSEDHAAALANSALDSQNKQHHMAGLSLPVEDLYNIPVHYGQALFALKQAGDKPGFYRLEDFALQYLLSLITQRTPKQCLIHPALLLLKRYDTEKGNELYETLFQYLLNERSITQCARALHMHKNTLIYRLQRIQEIIAVNLDDPMARNYLLLSYLIEKHENDNLCGGSLRT